MIRKILIILSFFFWILKIDMASSQQCTLNVSPLSFGTYDTFSNIPLDTSGTITINCDDVVRAEVKLGVSSNSGTFNPRRLRLTAGADLLDYNVYTDVGRTAVLGDGTGGSGTLRIQKPPGTPRRDPWSQTVTIYGRIPPGQEVSIGAYFDMITATVDP